MGLVVRGIFIFALFQSLVFGAYTEPKLTTNEEALTSAIVDKINQVDEFVEIRKMAESRGLRVWLFGGTAAAFAHYVKWDLLRLAGDDRYQPDRFDYDFMNIYRSTQDLDIVVDGNETVVQEFQEALQERFPYFMGSKEQWEVRSLRNQVGDKEALLDNPDFLNQHTDSNSTGMIELTSGSEGVIKDLRDWRSEHPQFLKDVTAGKLHYYFSESHEKTNRFKRGVNPPILSVVRYLTKAFQYELEISGEDRAKIKKVIDEFDAHHCCDPYLRNWLEKNVPKLVRHAVDIQYAWNVLEEVGLRQKLIQSSDPRRIGSMGWWVNREPLRDSADPGRLPTRGEPGRTAEELGITLVSHATRDFLAYESIRRSHKGVANVLISRTDSPGENAKLGNGFYTQVGREGAFDTGFHIRFTVDPNARENVDFVVEGHWLLWLTRDKLRVVQESLKFSPKAAISFLLSPEATTERGVAEMFRRKLARFGADTTPDVEAESAVDRAIQNPRTFPFLFQYVLNSKYFQNSPRWDGWISTLIEMPEAYPQLANTILNQPEMLTHPKFIEWCRRALEIRPDVASDILTLYSSREFMRNPAWAPALTRLIAEVPALRRAVLFQVLSKEALIGLPQWEKWIDQFVALELNDGGALERALIGVVLAHASVIQYAEGAGRSKWEGWITTLVKRGRVDYEMKSNFFNSWQPRLVPNSETRKSWVDGMISRRALDWHALVWVILAGDIIDDHVRWPVWFQALLDLKGVQRHYFLGNLLSHAKISSHPERWLGIFMKGFGDLNYSERVQVQTEIIDKVLAKAIEKEVPGWGDWINDMVEEFDFVAIKKLSAKIFEIPKVQGDPRFESWVDKILKGSNAVNELAETMVRSGGLRMHRAWPRWKALLEEKAKIYKELQPMLCQLMLREK
jgi:hypothetical protein